MAAVLLVACSNKSEPEVSQAAPAVAWWYNMEFRPAATTIHGFNARTIDGDWKRAIALDANLLKGRISEDDIQKFNASPLSFSLLSDVDGDGVSEEFFVGVYEATEGEKGRFVAITHNGQMLQHFKESGTSGFSALLSGDGEVRWHKCMECGEFESIRWRGEAYIIE